MSAFRPSSTSVHCRCSRRRRMMTPKLTAWRLVVRRRGMRTDEDTGRKGTGQGFCPHGYGGWNTSASCKGRSPRWLRCRAPIECPWLRWLRPACLYRVSMAKVVKTCLASIECPWLRWLRPACLYRVSMAKGGYDSPASIECPWLRWLRPVCLYRVSMAKVNASRASLQESMAKVLKDRYPLQVFAGQVVKDASPFQTSMAKVIARRVSREDGPAALRRPDSPVRPRAPDAELESPGDWGRASRQLQPHRPPLARYHSRNSFNLSPRRSRTWR